MERKNLRKRTKNSEIYEIGLKNERQRAKKWRKKIANNGEKKQDKKFKNGEDYRKK